MAAKKLPNDPIIVIVCHACDEGDSEIHAQVFREDEEKTAARSFALEHRTHDRTVFRTGGIGVVGHPLEHAMRDRVARFTDRAEREELEQKDRMIESKEHAKIKNDDAAEGARFFAEQAGARAAAARSSAKRIGDLALGPLMPAPAPRNDSDT